MRPNLEAMTQEERIATVRVALLDIYHRRVRHAAPNPSAVLLVKHGFYCAVTADGDDINLALTHEGKEVWQDGVSGGWLRLIQAERSQDYDTSALAFKISDIITQE